MPTKPMTFDVPEGFEQTAARFVAFLQEMQDAADQASDRTVLDTCEGVAMTQGREVQQEALRQALQRRIDVAEKKGRRAASVRVDAPKKIGVARRERS